MLMQQDATRRLIAPQHNILLTGLVISSKLSIPLDRRLFQLHGIIKRYGPGARSTRQNPWFRARHPRISSALYQVGPCVMTYVLIFPIGRTMEGVCARVDEFDFRIVDVYACRNLEVRLSVDNSARRRLTGSTGRIAQFPSLPFNRNSHRGHHPLLHRYH